MKIDHAIETDKRDAAHASANRPTKISNAEKSPSNARVLANVIPHTKMTINATRQEQNFIIPQQMTPLGAP